MNALMVVFGSKETWFFLEEELLWHLKCTCSQHYLLVERQKPGF